MNYRNISSVDLCLIVRFLSSPTYILIGHVSDETANTRVTIDAPILTSGDVENKEAELSLFAFVLRVAVGLASALGALASPQIPIDWASARDKKTYGIPPYPG